MKLLVTNDDGIDSIFLHELIHALSRAGHQLFIVAPKHEQSWIGAAKSRNRAVASEKADRGFNHPTWTVDGTPSDCVNIALAHLLPGAGTRLEHLDGVVSGINVGLNATLGFILASGTIGGAWEGALHGLPAIAFSQDLTFESYDALKYSGGRPEGDLQASLRHSAEHAAKLAPDLIGETEPRKFIVHNINFPFPCHPGSLLRHTVPAHAVVSGLFSPAADDGTHRFIYKLAHDISPANLPTDKTAVSEGFISHSILDYTRLGTPPS